MIFSSCLQHKEVKYTINMLCDCTAEVVALKEKSEKAISKKEIKTVFNLCLANKKNKQRQKFEVEKVKPDYKENVLKNLYKDLKKQCPQAFEFLH